MELINQLPEPLRCPVQLAKKYSQLLGGPSCHRKEEVEQELKYLCYQARMYFSRQNTKIRNETCPKCLESVYRQFNRYLISLGSLLISIDDKLLYLLEESEGQLVSQSLRSMKLVGAMMTINYPRLWLLASKSKFNKLIVQRGINHLEKSELNAVQVSILGNFFLHESFDLEQLRFYDLYYFTRQGLICESPENVQELLSGNMSFWIEASQVEDIQRLLYQFHLEDLKYLHQGNYQKCPNYPATFIRSTLRSVHQQLMILSQKADRYSNRVMEQCSTKQAERFHRMLLATSCHLEQISKIWQTMSTFLITLRLEPHAHYEAVKIQGLLEKLSRIGDQDHKGRLLCKTLHHLKWWTIYVSKWTTPTQVHELEQEQQDLGPEKHLSPIQKLFFFEDREQKRQENVIELQNLMRRYRHHLQAQNGQDTSKDTQASLFRAISKKYDDLNDQALRVRPDLIHQKFQIEGLHSQQEVRDMETMITMCALDGDHNHHPKYDSQISLFSDLKATARHTQALTSSIVRLTQPRNPVIITQIQLILNCLKGKDIRQIYSRFRNSYKFARQFKSLVNLLSIDYFLTQKNVYLHFSPTNQTSVGSIQIFASQISSQSSTGINYLLKGNLEELPREIQECLKRSNVTDMQLVDDWHDRSCQRAGRFIPFGKVIRLI